MAQFEWVHIKTLGKQSNQTLLPNSINIKTGLIHLPVEC